MATRAGGGMVPLTRLANILSSGGALAALAAAAAAACTVYAVLRRASAPSAPASNPLLHIVCLRFRDDLDDAAVIAHFERDVRLRARMPELVRDWRFEKNVSRADRADVNGGVGWVVLATLHDAAMLPAYLVHPEHQDVGRLQAPLITGKFVVDVATR